MNNTPRTDCLISSRMRFNADLIIGRCMFSLATWTLVPGILVITFTLDPEIIGGVVTAGAPLIAVGAFFALPFVLLISRKYIDYALPAFLYEASIAFSFAFIKSEAISSAVRVGFQMLGFILFLFILSTLQRDGPNGRTAKMWTRVLALSGGVLSVHYLSNIVQLVLDGRFADAIYERYVGGLMSLPWGASNTIASALIMPLAASLIAIASFGKQARLMRLTAIVIVTCILATMSRGAIVFLVVAAIAYSAMDKRPKTVLCGAAILIVVGAALTWFIGFDAVASYLDTRQFAENELATGNGRTDLWASAWDAIRAEFPFPIGYYGGMEKLGHSPHNFVLVDLLEIGWWGLAAFLWLHIVVFHRLLRRRRREKALGQRTAVTELFFCGLLAMLMHLLTEDAQYTQPHVIYYWIFMALAAHHAATVPPAARTVAAFAPPTARPEAVRWTPKSTIQKTV
jgi:O-antigen ligase